MTGSSVHRAASRVGMAHGGTAKERRTSRRGWSYLLIAALVLLSFLAWTRDGVSQEQRDEASPEKNVCVEPIPAVAPRPRSPRSTCPAYRVPNFVIKFTFLAPDGFCHFNIALPDVKSVHGALHVVATVDAAWGRHYHPGLKHDTCSKGEQL